MTDLAFDVNGEPFELPAAAAFWRVRRFRNAGGRGAPEVVFDRDGTPLVLPVDTDLGGFREQVGQVAARYRLDPLDERRRLVPDVPAAYLQIAEPARAAQGEDQGSVIRDLARANADMAKTIADKFAAVMQSAADLVRAADGAGLPNRKPPIEPRNGTPGDDELDDSDEPRSDLVEIVKHVMPLVQLAVGSMLSKTAPHGAANGTPLTRNVRRPVGAEATSDEVEDEVEDATLGEPDDEVTTPYEVRDPVAHLQAIELELTAEEVATVRRAMAEMAPEVVQAWCARLCTLPPAEAAEVVRGELAGLGGAK